MAKQLDHQALISETTPFSELITASGGCLSILDAECKLIWADEMYQSRYGPLESLIGQDCCDIHPLPDPRQCPAQKSLVTGKATNASIIIRSPDHPSSAISISAIPVLGTIDDTIDGAPAESSYVIVSIIDMSAALDRPQTLRYKASSSYLVEDHHMDSIEIIADAMPDAVVMIDDKSIVSYWNQASEKMFGVSHTDAIGRPLADLILKKGNMEESVAGWNQFLASGQGPLMGRTSRFRARHADGPHLEIELSLSSIFNNGRTHVIGSMRDKSQSDLEQLALKESQLVISEAQRIAKLGIWVSDFNAEDHSILSMTWSDELYDLLEYDRDTIKPGSAEFIQRVHKSDRQYLSLFHSDQTKTRDAWEITYRLEMPDGRLKHVVEASQVLTSVDNPNIRRLVTLAEITEFTLLEEQLADRSRQQAVVAELGLLAIGEGNFTVKLCQVLEKAASTLKVDYGEILEYQDDSEELVRRAAVGWDDSSGNHQSIISQAGYTITIGQPLISEDLLKEERFPVADELLDRGIRSSISLVIKTGEGPWGVLVLQTTEYAQFSNDIVNFLQAVANIAAAIIDENRSRNKLMLSAEMFNSNEPMFVTDSRGTILQVNQAFCDVYQVESDEVTGTSMSDLDADYEARMPDIKSLEAEGTWTGEVQHRSKSGRVPILITITRIYNDENETTNFVGHATDLTTLRKKEHELQHALRMDAVGQLSSGVAHDFNNLLGIIEGNLRFIQDECRPNPDVIEMFDDAFSAVRDGADLTRRLLSFSHALPENTRIVEVEDIIESMERFLTRAIGGEVEISSQHEEGNARIGVDVSALESAMLNLAINARDAMPHGGELLISALVKEIELSNPEDYNIPVAGEYVVIRMTDTGSGIDDTVLPFVFEPFYTTKGNGKGNGLGLSMVQNFLVASGGAGHIESEVGKGTTVSLLFPRIYDDIEDSIVEARTTPTPHGGLETILVVEDEPRLRRIVVRQLESLNYHVLEVENADMARAVIETGSFLDLVFTDIMMAGDMDGHDLALWLRSNYPQTKVLLTSGHSKASSVDFYPDIENFTLLRKPFNRQDLADQIRRLLDEE